MQIDIYCACNKKRCEGICKEKHLFRKRQQFDICPAACKKDDSRRRLTNFTNKDLKEIIK